MGDCQFLIFEEAISKTPENRSHRMVSTEMRDGIADVPRQDCRPQPSGKSVLDNREKAVEDSKAKYWILAVGHMMQGPCEFCGFLACFGLRP
jgi:hypothetical protein